MYGLGVGKVARDGSSQVWQSWIGLGLAVLRFFLRNFTLFQLTDIINF